MVQYGQHVNASALRLNYARLSLAPAVAQFRVHRAYIVALIRHPPDAYKRYIILTSTGVPGPRKLTVEVMLRMQARHALDHVDEIRALRRQYEEG